MLKTIPNIRLLQLLLVGSYFFGIPAANAAILKNMPSGGESPFLTNLSLPQSQKHEDSCRVCKENPNHVALGVSQSGIGYTGRQHDDTGLMYYRGRYRDSCTGSFISQDKVRDGWNWYGYTNDPVNMVDLSGMVSHDIFMSGVGVDGMGGGGSLSNSAISSLPPISDSHAQFLGDLAGFTGGLVAGAVGGSILGPVSLGLSELSMLAPFAPILGNSLANQWADFQNSSITEKAFIAGSLIGGSSFGSPGAAFTKNTTKNCNNQLVTVTSWADKGIEPDLNPRRWVVLGEATKLNFFKTRLWGPKATGSVPNIKFIENKSDYTNSLKGEIPISALEQPAGLGFDGIIKRLFGQYRIKK